MTALGAELRSLSLGFRSRYLRYAELTQQLRNWADRYPELVKLQTLGQSPQGRELWLLTVGPHPARARPAVWVDGNMHAIEFAGSSVALAIAEDALRLHLEPEAALHALPRPVRDAARRVLFHIVPRVSPDGAEELLGSGRYVRSVPRDSRAHRSHPRWVGADIDGDGAALSMRVQDPTGEFVESQRHPGMMLLRELDDTGPFYKIYPEGLIEHYDGSAVPDPGMLADNAPDLNRNFPHHWAPEHEQAGAGDFPASEPESRAIVEFASRTPNLFAWLNLHTFGGVYIRPPGHAPEAQMDRSDLALYRQVEAWAEQLTGYPTVCSYEEFTYEPDTPLRGNLTDYAYAQRGCLALVCELWDIFRELGLPRQRPFVNHYTHLSRDDAERLADWDGRVNGGRIVSRWKPVQHPQLGPVEVGGFDSRVGIANPPEQRLEEICDRQAALWLRVASLAPHLVITDVAHQALGDGATRLDLTVANLGYLPTHILESARALDWNESLWAEIETEGCRLADPSQRRRDFGHLDGWGRGRFSPESPLFFPLSRGSSARRRLSWVLLGTGRVRLRVGACRTGWIEHHLELGSGR